MNSTVDLADFVEMNDVYNPHVKGYPNIKYPDMKTPFVPLDYSLGFLLILCALIGIPGNILGVFYFTSMKKKDRVTLLYIIICSIDITTSFSHLPVAIATPLQAPCHWAAAQRLEVLTPRAHAGAPDARQHLLGRLQ